MELQEEEGPAQCRAGERGLEASPSKSLFSLQQS